MPVKKDDEDYKSLSQVQDLSCQTTSEFARETGAGFYESLIDRKSSQ